MKYIIILLIMISGCTPELEDASLLITDEFNNQFEEVTNGLSGSPNISFTVTIPENTPTGDVVYLYTTLEHGVEAFAMGQTDEYTYQLSLAPDNLSPTFDAAGQPVLQYRYNRNGMEFITAEYLEPDTNDHFWTELGRSIVLQPGQVQTDIVTRWRWLPEGDFRTQSDIAPDKPFKPRIDGKSFRSGQLMQDLYSPAFDAFFNSTARHMKAQGYTWVFIAPPWDWVQDDLPLVGNPIDVNPNYPDEKLIAQIQAFKNSGLRVHMAPQICCTIIDTRNRSAEWWETYFSEIERFTLHHARIAEETGVDSFTFDVYDEKNAPFNDTDERVLRSLQNLKQAYTGEIGSLAWNFGTTPEQMTTFPQPEFFTWGNHIDFFVMQIDANLSARKNASDAELVRAAGQVIDGAKGLYDKYGKPVVVQTVYASVDETWRGSSAYDINLMNAPWNGEQEWQQGKYTFSGRDQARVVHAYFNAVAERPWVLGMVQFGYWHWDMPLAPDMSVRSKEAETVWQRWNDVIYASQTS